MIHMISLIVFLPLIGFLVAGGIALFSHGTPALGAAARSHAHDDHHGHDHGHHGHDDHGHGHDHHETPASTKAAMFVTAGLMIIAALMSWVVFFQTGFGHGGVTKVAVLPWIHTGDLAIDWALRVDTLTAVMLVVVNTVSALVHVYSIGYMSHDEHRPRFFAYLSFFTFAMLALVTSDNLLQMFFGWEGVGVASYLLIGFWFQKPSANAAAIKAFVVNRVGDFGFILGIFGVYVMTKAIGYDAVFESAKGLVGQKIFFLGAHVDALTTICLLLFMGAMGKSAQFLLHTWLPDAMEGPTPVSALIHAATMVTAGVFMVARLSPLFDLAPAALTIVTIVGATTAFFAATVGLVQNDIKRVIAYSTCSQLGYMFAALGVGAYGAAVFHLFTHAFFKALLFLGAGSVIHAVDGEQDMRNMGGLREKIPMTYRMMILGTLALTGVGVPVLPLDIAGVEFGLGFAGFNSKDAIIEAVYAAHGEAAGYAFTALVLAAFMTSFYSWRLIFKTFHGTFRAKKDVWDHAHESPPVMLVPLYVLGAGAVFAGMVFSYAFIGHGYEHFWREALFTNADNKILEEMHHVPVIVKAAPFIAMILGLGLSYLFYIRNPKLPEQMAADHELAYKFLLNKWYFDEIYEFLFVKPAKWIGRFLWKQGDGWLIDGFGPDGVSARVVDLAGRVARLQTGFIYHYAFAMLIGVAALVTWMMFTGAH
jgi:NADH-quinone oxidoreductase subunit L